MYPLGHVGMALLVVAPAALLLDRKRRYLPIAGLALLTSLLPDADTPIPLTHHHGGMHTLVFAFSASLAVGLAFAFVSVNSLWLARRIDGLPSFRPQAAFALGFGGSFAGLGSHIVADVLPVPIDGNPVKPLWPILDAEVALGLMHPGDLLWNWGLLAAGLVAQAIAFAVVRSRDASWANRSSG
jgi:membrane-bound metal-dependent hydrolase YbcI (DUF457 family)